MQALTPVLEAAPETALISIDDAKRQVRRDDNDDDTYLTGLIAVVMARLDGIDGILSRCLIRQTWSETFDKFPSADCLPLALAPLIDVVSIEYFDDDNVSRTFDAANYSAHNRAKSAYVKLATTASWPGSYERDDAVKVTYRAGYGAAATDVPAPIKLAALLLLGHYYENREATLVGTVATPLPEGVMSLLRPFIRPHF